MELQHPLQVQPLGTSAAALSPSRLTPVLRFAIVTYLVGMLVLSPEQFLTLPQNLTSGDFWNLLFLPVCWAYLVYTRRPIRFPYALGIWFIWLGSFIGALFSFDLPASIIFITKEVYLYVWFVTLVSIFASLEPGLLRRILLVWVAVAVLHGILLVAEFVSPDFYGFMILFVGRIGTVNYRLIGRPTGLFENPGWAALFELTGFVPLLLGGLRRGLSFLLGMILLLGIFSAASLGSLSSLLGALVLAVLLLLFMGGHLKFLVWLAAIVTLGAGLFYFTIRLFPDIQARLEHLTTQRAEYTTDQRLELWEGGREALFSPKSILGVGPDNYRDSTVNKTLHNDFLEFAVERGVLGLLGLALLTSEAWISAIKILLNQIRSGDTARPSGVVFLAMLFGILLEANAHQIFHFRTLWWGLALLEATRFRMVSPLIEADKQGELWDETLQSPEKSSLLTVRRDPSSVEAG
jgi:O-antigen ligase